MLSLLPFPEEMLTSQARVHWSEELHSASNVAEQRAMPDLSLRKFIIFSLVVVECCKMCYSREAYCQCCKLFIRILKVNTCDFETCAKTVFPKLSLKCQDCQTCKNICCKFKIPRKWVQTDKYYINQFVVAGEKIEIFLYAESKCSYLTILSKDRKSLTMQTIPECS